jgi:hypothetical protein
MPAQKYDVHPGVKMMQDWIGSLKAKTGRSLEEWVRLVKKEGPKEEEARRAWLKEEHGLRTNAAWWIAERADSSRAGTWDDDPESYLKCAVEYVEGQYAAKRSGLRPIYDELHKVGRGLGKDVKVCPCKTMVPLYREHVFAQIKPATNSRVDLGLALGDYKGKLPAGVIDTGGKEKKDRITHRIALASTQEIDADVKKWLNVAYDLDGK